MIDQQAQARRIGIPGEGGVGYPQLVKTRHSALVKSLDRPPLGREGQRVGFFLLYDMADRLCSNIPVDKKLDLSRMDDNVMEDEYVGSVCRNSFDDINAGAWSHLICCYLRHDWLDGLHNAERGT